MIVDTFCKNPQFWLRINEFDKACEQGQNNVLVTLIQKPDKRHRRRAAHHGIGFYVFAVSINKKGNKYGCTVYVWCLCVWSVTFIFILNFHRFHLRQVKYINYITVSGVSHIGLKIYCVFQVVSIYITLFFIPFWHIHFTCSVKRLGYIRNPHSLMEGMETLCCDDIRGLT